MSALLHGMSALDWVCSYFFVGALFTLVGIGADAREGNKTWTVGQMSICFSLWPIVLGMAVKEVWDDA